LNGMSAIWNRVDPPRMKIIRARRTRSGAKLSRAGFDLRPLLSNPLSCSRARRTGGLWCRHVSSRRIALRLSAFAVGSLSRGIRFVESRSAHHNHPLCFEIIFRISSLSPAGRWW
jgi:hypothetical protein